MAVVLTRGTGERGEVANGDAIGNGSGGWRCGSVSGCGRGERRWRLGIGCGGGGGGARARNWAEAHRRRRMAAASGAEGIGGERARVWLGKGNGAFERGGRGGERVAAGSIPPEAMLAQPAGVEAMPPRGEPTGRGGGAGKTEGGADGWGRGRRERLTGGAGPEK
ncbi:glycine-rich cell wall structural protein 1.8-like [Panicum hallii]|uniref:glycine-rich cell wall structural protein 1.8-like n=1 Tax=Panicum hallii TaxID=206008 RepID=UPI000DF4E6B1|nr:glycine-rich cell wall structural protein 1.8-like [Panicum hallii]